MITPELQQYINQQKSAGASDVQIRQNLLTQGGWSQADLDQAFGVQGSMPQMAQGTPIYSGTVQPNNTKKIAMGIVALIVLVAVAGFGWNWMQKKSLEGQLENSLEQAYGGNADVKIGKDYRDISVKTDTGSFSTGGNIKSMPAGWPSEIPQYPNSKISTSMSNSESGSAQLIVALTTQDPPEKVIAFYELKFDFNGWTNIKSESFGGMFVVSGEKNGHLMAINVHNAGGQTNIGMIYRNKD